MNENMRFGLIVFSLVIAGAMIVSLFTGSGDPIEDAVEPLSISSTANDTPEIEFDPVSQTQKHAHRLAPPTHPADAEETVVPVTTVKRASNRSKKGPGRVFGELKAAEGTAIDFPVEVKLIRIPERAALHAGDDNVVATQEVGTDKSYSFDDLPLEKYMLVAVSPSHTGNTSANLSPERKSWERDISLYPGGTITGQVMTKQGQPIPEAQLFVAAYLSGGSNINASESRSVASKTVADEDGQFVMAGLQIRGGVPLDYRLLAKAEGYANHVTDMITVGTFGVIIQLDERHTASGHLLSKEDETPVPDVRVFVTREMALDVVQAVTDEEGAFELAGLDSGNYDAHLDHPTWVVDHLTASFDVPVGQNVEDVEIHVLAGGVISGRVFNADTSAGVPNAQVTARRQQQSRTSQNTHVFTDATGAYSVAGLETGTYEMNLEKVDGFPDTRRRAGRQLISVTAGQEVTGMDFPLSQGITISGVVVDQDGNPLETATINARDDRNDTYDYDRTDAQGRFTVAGFTEGNIVRLSVGKGGYGSIKDTTERLTKAPLAGLRYVLGPESTISGVVVNKDGTPRPSVQMLAVPEKNNNDGNRIYSAGADGKFEMEQLAAGNYDIHFYHNQWNRSAPPAAKVTLESGKSVTGLRLVYEFPDGFIVAGKVVNAEGKPIGYASIQAQGAGWGHTQSDAAGNFSFSLQGEGEYSLVATHNSYSQTTVRNIFAGSEDVEIVMSGQGKISGQLINAVTREPIQQFQLHVRRGNSALQPHMNSQFKVFHDVNGRFEVTNAEEGANTLTARAQGYAESELQISNVVPGETIENIQIALSPGVSLSGTVMNAAREPISGAMLFFGSVPNYNQEEAARGRSKTDGTYTIDSLPTGPFILSVYHPKYAQQSIELNLRSGLNNRRDIVLSSGGTLEGFVTMNNVAVTNEYVSVHYPSQNGQGYREDTRTDNQGFYQLTGLPEGTATLSPSATTSGGTRRNKNMQAEIVDGMTTHLDINFLDGTSSVEGYVYKSENELGTGLYMSVHVETPSGREGGSTQTDANGYFYIGDLPAGSARVQIYGGGSQKTVRLELKDGEAVRKDIMLFGGNVVACTVHNAPATQQYMQLFAIDGHREINQNTTYAELESMFRDIAASAQVSNGKAELSGLEPGTYTVVALSQLSQQPDPNDIMASMRLASTHVTVTEGVPAAAELRF